MTHDPITYDEAEAYAKSVQTTARAILRQMTQTPEQVMNAELFDANQLFSTCLIAASNIVAAHTIAESRPNAWEKRAISVGGESAIFIAEHRAL